MPTGLATRARLSLETRAGPHRRNATFNWEYINTWYPICSFAQQRDVGTAGAWASPSSMKKPMHARAASPVIQVWQAVDGGTTFQPGSPCFTRSSRLRRHKPTLASWPLYSPHLQAGAFAIFAYLLLLLPYSPHSTLCRPSHPVPASDYYLPDCRRNHVWT